MICVVTTAPGRPHVGNLERRLRGHQACWVEDKERRGTVISYRVALQVALDLAERYRLGRVLILQDDVELCAGALEYIDVVPQWYGQNFDGVLLWCCPGVSSSNVWTENGRWSRMSTVYAYGVTWDVGAIRRVLSSPLWKIWTSPVNVDSLLTAIIADEPGLSIWRHVPDLVQHVGDISLAHPGIGLTDTRRSGSYPGADFDARTLWASGKAVGHGG